MSDSGLSTSTHNEMAGLYQQAIQARASGQFHVAEQLTRQILKARPEHPDALHLLGLLAAEAGRGTVAVELLAQAIRHHPGNPDFYANLALTLEHEGHAAAAATANRLALEIDPGHPAAWFNLGNALRTLEQLDDAVAAYRHAIRSGTGSAREHASLAAVLHRSGQSSQALSEVQTALATDDGQSEIHATAGMILHSLGRKEEAVKAHARAVELQPDSAEAMNNLAVAQLAAGQPDPALETLRRCRELAPQDRTTMALTAIAMLNSGNETAAREWFDFDRFVQLERIALPAGFTTLEDFNSALAEHVRAHSSLQFEPATKSTRQGSQSRNLLEDAPAVIATLVESIEAQIRTYFDTHPADAAHPFLAWRPQRWRLNVWATLLERSGHQLPHIHPAGWLSGVYYVAVPDIKASDEQQAGWLEFGAAPDTLAGNSAAITRRIAPEAGTMVLFPSWLYHQTVPYAGTETRISIAFDVIPIEEDRDMINAEESISITRSLLRHGLPTLAADVSRNLAATVPEHAQAHQMKALAATRLARFDEAIHAWQKALERAPERADWELELASVLRTDGRHDEALRAYERAVSLAPLDAAMHLAHGTLLTDLGRFEAAGSAYEEALRLQPALGRAHYGLASVRRFNSGDPRITQMEDMLASEEALTDSDRAALHFALGRAWDQLAEPDRAFPHFAAGNRIKRTQTPFDLAAERDNARRIIASFTPELLAAAGGNGHPGERPVFVVGMPRSGTTLVEQILDSHPLIHGAGEINDLWRCAGDLRKWLPPGERLPEAAAKVPPDGWLALGQAYEQSVAALAPAAARVVDKLPFNYTLIGIIHLCLPSARIIHCVRDPLDTCLSCFFTSFGGDRGFTADLSELGGTYRCYEQLMAHWQALLPDTILEVRYEELVADVETAARRMISHLGLDWSNQCLNYASNPRVVDTASHVQVRQPAYQSSVGRAQRYAAHLAPLRAALAGRDDNLPGSKP